MGERGFIGHKQVSLHSPLPGLAGCLWGCLSPYGRVRRRTLILCRAHAARMLKARMSNQRPTFLRNPYASPDVKIGDAIVCAIRGLVEVRSWHDKGAIGVPLGGVKGTRWSIVVSHDLLRALYAETSVAIQFYWAVSEPTVANWRRALEIDSRATASFVQTMSQVGSVSGRAPGVAERLRTMNTNPWSREQLRMLSALSTAEMMCLTGRSREAVEHARSRYNLAQARDLLTCPVCGHAWLPHHGRVPLRCPKQNCRQPLNKPTRPA